MIILTPPPVKYRGTLTGLRISSVDGTAFIDNAGATVPTYADGNHQIEIYDAEGRMLKGVLKAAGTGETLANTGGPLDNGELIDDPGFDDNLKWTPEDGWSVAGGKGVKVSGTGRSLRSTTNVVSGTHALYRTSLDIDETNGAVAIRIWSVGLSGYLGSNILHYTTVPSSEAYKPVIIMAQATPTATVDNFSAKQVLTPSADGCTIVSAAGGATQNFAYKNASFAYNAGNYAVIVRALR